MSETDLHAEWVRVPAFGSSGDELPGELSVARGLIATDVQRGDIVLLTAEAPLSVDELAAITAQFERVGIGAVVMPPGVHLDDVLRLGEPGEGAEE